MKKIVYKMDDKEVQAEGYCKVRKDLLNKYLLVPIGDKYAKPRYELQYRWLDDDTVFQVLYLGEWQEASSIDFDFK